MTVENTLFKKRLSYLVTHESGQSKIQVYCLLSTNRRKFLKDIIVLLSEECITQHKPLVCDFKIRKVKDTRRNSVHRRKIWKLHDDSFKSDFRSYINKYRANSLKGPSVECYWNILKGALPEATEGYCRQTKTQLDIKSMVE